MRRAFGGVALAALSLAPSVRALAQGAPAPAGSEAAPAQPSGAAPQANPLPAQPSPAPAPPAAAPTQPPTAQAPSPAPANPPAPAAPAPTTAQPAPPPATQGTPATVLDTQDYDAIMGKSVRSAAGEDMGRIIDMVIDRDGKPRAAIIDFGGFLGVGSRKIAVDWRALHFTPDGKPSRIVLQLTRNQVRVSPEYKAGEPIVVLGPASPASPQSPASPPTPVSQPAPDDQARAATPEK